MIYDYLFFKGYQLAKKSKNWEDTPLLLGIMVVGSGFIANLYTLKFLFDIFFGSNAIFNKDLGIVKYLVASVLFLLLLLYYTYRDRGKKIVTKYEARESERGKSIHPVVPVLIYLFLSIILMFLVGMYKHKYWIFA